MNHLPITNWSRERTDQCLEEKEGEGAEIEELEPGNGQQAGKRLGRLLRTIWDLLTVWLELELTVMRVDLVGEWSRVDSEQGDEVAAEERELEAHLGHVVRVHRQRLSNTLDQEESWQQILMSKVMFT